MSAPLPPELSPTAVSAPEDRPRKSTGAIVLLSVLTMANLLVVVLSASGWSDAVEHGDEDAAGLLAFSTVVTSVGLVGLGGGWATRKWGPWLYLGAIVVDRIVAVVAAPGLILLAVPGVLLAALLVRIAERSW